MQTPVYPARPRPILRLFRGAVATIVGVVTAGLCVAGVEALGHELYGAPAASMVEDPQAMAAHVAGLPADALLLVLAAWILGAFAGGSAAAWIAQRRPRLYGGLIAALILIGAVLSFSRVPHPPWFVVLSLLSLPLIGFMTGRLAEAHIAPSPPSKA